MSAQRTIEQRVEFGPDGKLHRHTCAMFSPNPRNFKRKFPRCTCGLPKENAEACKRGEMQAEYLERVFPELEPDDPLEQWARDKLEALYEADEMLATAFVELKAERDRLRAALERVVETSKHWSLGSAYTADRHLDAVRTARNALEEQPVETTASPAGNT